MGQNRRYGSDITRAAIAESVTRPAPVSLSVTEAGENVTETAAPIPVVAWVPFRTEQSVQVDGHVIASTDSACLVRFTTRAGVTHEVWLWRGAVRVEAPRGD